METTEKKISNSLKQIALKILQIDQDLYIKRLYMSEVECHKKLLDNYRQELEFWNRIYENGKLAALESESAKKIAQNNIKIYEFLLNKLQRESQQSAKFI